MNSENTTSDSAPTLAGFPTAMADGLATSLFVADSNELSHVFTFDCAVLDADRHATVRTYHVAHRTSRTRTNTNANKKAKHADYPR